MSLDLQTRLLGAHQRHNKLSVKKVIGSLRGGSVVIARTLRVIAETSEVPGKSDSSTPALESAATKVVKTRPKIKCSPYVIRTCEVLLEKCKATGPLTGADGHLSCEDFFLTLVEAGPSPLLLQWQEDGFDPARVREIFAEAKAELEHEKQKRCKTQVSGTMAESSPMTVTEISPSKSSHVKDVTDISHTGISGLSLGKEDIDVFISYSREQNTTSIAINLKRDLEKEGIKVWLDLTDISSGSDWHSAIGEGLRKCKALIPIITRRYLHSKYCKNELFMADSLQKDIFPIFLEDLMFDSSDDAGVQYVISSINWIMMTPGKLTYNEALMQLLAGMSKKGLVMSTLNEASSVSDSHGSTDGERGTDTKHSDESVSRDCHKEEEKWHDII